jgi:hypothetical protein
VRSRTIAGNQRVPRWSTSSTAASVASATRTTSARAKTPAGLGATSAPAAAGGAVAAAVRFHTTSGVPARARLSAIGPPMIPRPRNPTVIPPP